MLEQSDTAIAFSVVMLMLSSIVTAVVQLISASPDLRGRNLASGPGNLFHQIEPAFRVRPRLRRKILENIDPSMTRLCPVVDRLS
jgi:hypothetical protein